MGAAVSQEYPTIDGIAPSWADIVTTIQVAGGVTLKDIDYAAFNTDTVVEVGDQVGASGGRVMRRTSGSKKDSASATYYRSGLRKLIKALIPYAPTRGNQVLISLVHFDILIQHTPPGESEIYQLKIKGARLTQSAFKFAEGNEADKVEVTFSTAEVVQIIDGKEVVLL
jgi:hypothetical protein